MPLPGGAAAIRQPWRMAVAYLDAAYGDDLPDLPVLRRHADTWPAIVPDGPPVVNAPLTSSAGRLFDAVAALLDLRDDVNYEGQAAIELEQLADRDEAGTYPRGHRRRHGPRRGPGPIRVPQTSSAVRPPVRSPHDSTMDSWR